MKALAGLLLLGACLMPMTASAQNMNADDVKWINQCISDNKGEPGGTPQCQSAFKFDPGSASNFDPFERRVLTGALASSELAGVAETWRARVA